MIRGRVWCFGADINTDLIQPTHVVVRPPAEQTAHVFEANRPGWVDLVEPGDVIVAGRNFGTGSSRPAARVLKDLGIGGVIADSINGLFLRNCVNYSFPALECPGVREAFAEGDRIAFALETGAVRNESTGVELAGRAWDRELLEIFEAGGLLAQLRAQGLLVVR